MRVTWVTPKVTFPYARRRREAQLPVTLEHGRREIVCLLGSKRKRK